MVACSAAKKAVEWAERMVAWKAAATVELTVDSLAACSAAQSAASTAAKLAVAKAA